jgi:hypothetical protein
MVITTDREVAEKLAKAVMDAYANTIGFDQSSVSPAAIGDHVNNWKMDAQIYISNW